MGIGTPLHAKTSTLCKSLNWKEWAGYFAVESYETCHLPEYHAIRQAAGLMDISPLYKYDIKGKDAFKLINYIMAKDFNKVAESRVAYCSWCDDDGKIIDDGTVFCFNREHYRVTSANPCLRWFSGNSHGLDVTVEDISWEIAAMSLQGPNSRAILKQVCDADLDNLKFFALTQAEFEGGIEAVVSRTGYTGDLGYEIWTSHEKACSLWDVILENGKNYNIMPNGLLALDMARIEAGLILIDVDFVSSKNAFIEEQKSTPYEVGLGWTVNLDKGNFIGKKSLLKSSKAPKYSLVGLEIDWDELEAHFEKIGLPPELPHTAWRTPVPIYNNKNKQIGRANSGCFSPIMKKNLALATVEFEYRKRGTKLKIEVTVEYERKLVTATVVKKPFFNPPRKRK